MGGGRPSAAVAAAPQSFKFYRRRLWVSDALVGLIHQRHSPGLRPRAPDGSPSTCPTALSSPDCRSQFETKKAALSNTPPSVPLVRRKLEGRGSPAPTTPLPPAPDGAQQRGPPHPRSPEMSRPRAPPTAPSLQRERIRRKPLGRLEGPASRIAVDTTPVLPVTVVRPVRDSEKKEYAMGVSRKMTTVKSWTFVSRLHDPSVRDR